VAEGDRIRRLESTSPPASSGSAPRKIRHNRCHDEEGLPGL